MASSENMLILIVAKSRRIYRNGLVLESDPVSKSYDIPPQCNIPIPSKRSGIYIDDSISISFSSVENIQILYSLDGDDYAKLNGSIDIRNDGLLHTLQVYSISVTCYPSPIVELKFEMRQVVSVPTIQPPPDYNQGNLYGTHITINCSTVGSVAECFHNSIRVNSTDPQDLIDQTLWFPLNLTCRCSNNEKKITSEWLTYLYTNLYYIPKPILSVLSSTHVGPLQISLECEKVYSSLHSCDGFIYTTDNAIPTITKPNMIGTTTILLNENFNRNETHHQNETIPEQAVINLYNQGLNNLKVVAFDKKTGVVSPQVEEQYFIIGVIDNPRISVSPSLEKGETLESKLFINTAVIVIDFENLDAVASEILIINRLDGSRLTSIKLTPFTLVLEYNCTVRMNYTKLHHLPSSEYSFSVHVKKVNSNNLFPSIPFVLTSSLQETLFNVQVVLVVVGLFVLAFIVALITLFIIVKKRRNHLHNKKLLEYDANFDNIILHSREEL